jgi:hypothetical protein
VSRTSPGSNLLYCAFLNLRPLKNTPIGQFGHYLIALYLSGTRFLPSLPIGRVSSPESNESRLTHPVLASSVSDRATRLI